MNGRRFFDPVLGALGVLGVTLALWFLVGPAGATTSWAVQTALDVMAATGAWWLARQTTGHRSAHRFWVAAAFASACCAVGDGYQTGLTALGLAGEQPSLVQTGCLVLGMGTLMIVMLFHPLGGAGRQRLRLWLDAATVLAAVAVFLWYFVLADVVTSGSRAQLLGVAATSAILLVITFGLLKLMLSGTAPFARGPGTVATVGVAGTGVAASIATLMTGGDSPGVVYVAQLLPCLLMPISMRLQALHLRRARAADGTRDRRRSSRLPYVAVVAVQLLLLAALAAQSGDLRIWGVAVGTVTITALVLSRQSAAFTDNERLLAEVDRGLAEVHVLHEELRHRATHDPLTGLANRDLLEQRLHELAPDDRVTMLLIDLDGFKPVNDEHGHHAGDQVLTAVAARLAARTPSDGLAVRLGGDEFAVLLPGTHPVDIGDLVLALSEPIALPGTGHVRIGASVGRAEGSPREGARLLREADAAMYRTKAARKTLAA